MTMETSISGTEYPIHFGEVSGISQAKKGKSKTFSTKLCLESVHPGSEMRASNMQYIPQGQNRSWETVGSIRFKYQRNQQHIAKTCAYMCWTPANCGLDYFRFPSSSWRTLPPLPPNLSLASPTFEPKLCMSAKYMITSGAGLRFDGMCWVRSSWRKHKSTLNASNENGTCCGGNLKPYLQPSNIVE